MTSGFHPIASAVRFRKLSRTIQGNSWKEAGSTLKRKSHWQSAASAKCSLSLLTAFLVLAGGMNSLFGERRARVVTNLDDGGLGSLREQIATARAGETISFAVRGTIVLTNGEL